ncbi:MAG: ABC transporter substrate-binding protein [Hyphomicrobium sp.]
MIDRRLFVVGTAAAFTLPALTTRVAAQAAALKIASVKFGSLSWLLETIRAEGLDKKHALTMDVIEIASNQGSAVALYGGSADVVVSDWPWGLRQRSMGEALKFAPFSSALGSIMVAEQSPIKSYSDLGGKRLGVAGSAIDKSWLLLRAYSMKVHGKDIATFAEPQFGAAPLLAEQLRDGKLDAALNFWTFSARLKGDGFRTVLTMSQVMTALGIDPQPSLVGFIWKEATEAAQPGAIKALLAAAQEGNAILAKSDEAWERLKPLMKTANDNEFQALREGYRQGIPGPWRDADMRSAEKIMNLLIESGDTDLVGNGTRFDTKLFHTAGA